MVKARSSASVAPLIVVASTLAAIVAAALSAIGGTTLYTDLGLADPGQVTSLGLPIVRTITEIASVVCIGSLLFAAFLVPPQPSGTLSAGGYAALRRAAGAGAVWCVGALLAVPFTISDSSGQPISEVLRPNVFLDLLGSLEQAKAWLITAVMVAVLTVALRVVLSWGWTASLFVLAVVSWFPVGFTGHSSSGGAHDLATNSLLIHLIAASVWVGGLVAVLAHAVRSGDHLTLASSRFSAVAGVCWALMAVSGVLNALVRVPLSTLFTSTYGALVLVKTAALVVLGGFGYLQRRRALEPLRAGKPGAFTRFAALEVVLMFATIGVAAALARTAPPANPNGNPGTIEVLIGYPLHGAPTVWRLLFDWRYDLIFGTLAIGLAFAYVAAVLRLRKRGDRWPVGRTLAWLAGCLAIFMATSSGIGRYSPAMFSVHMGSHMLLNMAAPVLLVLGGPVTLALRALPVAGKDNPPGPREWLLSFVHSPVARVLSHPLVSLVLFVGSFYALYFSGLFDALLPNHWGHLLMNAHFLLIGYMFYWPIIGIDPAPKRLPHLGRLGLLLASMPFHAFFGITLMSSQTVIGENFYRSLRLPWATNLLTDQRLGGGIAWAFGEIPLLLVVVALLVQWSRADERQARRDDRRAESDGNADLVAYNAMLSKMAGKQQD